MSRTPRKASPVVAERVSVPSKPNSPHPGEEHLGKEHGVKERALHSTDHCLNPEVASP
jgi:hypothetical protein